MYRQFAVSQPFPLQNDCQFVSLTQWHTTRSQTKSMLRLECRSTCDLKVEHFLWIYFKTFVAWQFFECNQIENRPNIMFFHFGIVPKLDDTLDKLIFIFLCDQQVRLLNETVRSCSLVWRFVYVWEKCCLVDQHAGWDDRRVGKQFSFCSSRAIDGAGCAVIADHHEERSHILEMKFSLSTDTNWNMKSNKFNSKRGLKPN